MTPLQKAEAYRRLYHWLLEQPLSEAPIWSPMIRQAVRELDRAIDQVAGREPEEAKVIKLRAGR